MLGICLTAEVLVLLAALAMHPAPRVRASAGPAGVASHAAVARAAIAAHKDK